MSQNNIPPQVGFTCTHCQQQATIKTSQLKKQKAIIHKSPQQDMASRAVPCPHCGRINIVSVDPAWVDTP